MRTEVGVPEVALTLSGSRHWRSDLSWGPSCTPVSSQAPSQPKSWPKVLEEDSGMGPSSELWDSAHLKGLFHFSPASLSGNAGSAARARVSASSLIPSPNVSGLLGERIKLRMAKGPGQPLRATVRMCRPRDEGVPVDARVAGAGAGSYDHTCLHVSWARSAWGPRHRGCAHLQ